jgi:hypothetical protein
MRRARVYEDIEIDQRNWARMKYNRRSGRETRFSPWRLETHNPHKGGEEEGSHGGGP